MYIPEDFTYSTKELIEDLKEELQQHSEQLTKILPDRVKRYKDYWLSNIWDYCKNYVNTLKAQLKEDPKQKIYEFALFKLKKNLKSMLKGKSNECKAIIKLYEKSTITANEFFDRLRDELGRVSGQIPITFVELGYILVGSTRFITYVWDRINYPARYNYSPDYGFSLERLNQFKENLDIIFGEKAKNCKELIERYKNANPDLKEYKNQQFEIRNPHIFKKLDDVKKLYWFGFLCADGWLIESMQRIGLELAIKDKNHIEAWVEFVGLPLGRIKERVRFLRLKSGEVTAHDMCYVIFQCKPMYQDLLGYGFRDTTSKTKRKLKHVPPIIQILINKAKLEASSSSFIISNINSIKISKSKLWYYTKSGSLALAWLLGFYDGDGHYMGGRSALITSSSSSFLKDVKQIFMSKNRVRDYENFSSLSLGPSLFDALMFCFKNSMTRKRSNN